MQREIDPKLIIGICALLVVGVGWILYAKFSSPADFAGPPVKIKAPRGFAIPGRGSAGVQTQRIPGPNATQQGAGAPVSGKQ